MRSVAVPPHISPAVMTACARFSPARNASPPPATPMMMLNSSAQVSQRARYPDSFILPSDLWVFGAGSSICDSQSSRTGVQPEARRTDWTDWTGSASGGVHACFSVGREGSRSTRGWEVPQTADGGGQLPPSPEGITTRAEFADGLKQLMNWSRRSYRGIEIEIRRKGDTISHGTAENLTAGRTVPKLSSLTGFLKGCGLVPEQQESWFEKYQQVYSARSAVQRSTVGGQGGPTPEEPGRWLMTGTGGARAEVGQRSRGQLSAAGGGDLFCGRQLALDYIREWLTADEPPGQPLVITGQPGAGKSVVLARAVFSAESEQDGTGLAFYAHVDTPGCSPWRLLSAHGGYPATSRTVTAGRG
jgi:hypothetical protein